MSLGTGFLVPEISTRGVNCFSKSEISDWVALGVNGRDRIARLHARSQLAMKDEAYAMIDRVFRLVGDRRLAR